MLYNALFRVGKSVRSSISVLLALALAVLLLFGVSLSSALAEDPTPGDQNTAQTEEPHTTPPAVEHALTPPANLTVTVPATGEHPAIPATGLPDLNAPAVNQALQSAGLDGELSQAEIDQLREILKGGVSEQDMVQLKALAAKIIEQRAPSMIDKIEERYIEKQNQRLMWVGLVIVLALPLLALVGFLLYPVIARKSIQKRIPNAPLGRFYRLYIVQAIVVTLVLLVLGVALWGIQFMTGRLGGITNPQLIIQRESVQYVIDNREDLIDNYTDVFMALARDIAEDPEASIDSVILENARQLREDPLVNFAADVTNFVMPFLNYVSLVSFCLLVLFFLIRIAPDIKNMLRYPIEILAAAQEGRGLPQFESSAKGVPSPATDPNGSVWKVGRWMMWMEVKVIACFAVATLVLALLMGFFLNLFFLPVVGMLVENISQVVEYFLRFEGASSIVLATTVITLLFVVECVALFLMAFVFLLIRLQETFRQRFALNITWKQSFTYLRGVMLRFGWVMLLAAGLGMGLPVVSDKVDDLLYNHGKDPNWFLLLISTPLILFIGLNLVMFLLRGFRSLVNLFKKSAVKEFDLKKPKQSKEKVLAGSAS